MCAGASYQDGKDQIGVGTEIKSFVLPMFILKCLGDVQTEMPSRYEPVLSGEASAYVWFQSLDDIIR